jgi:hypothetical protein
MKYGLSLIIFATIFVSGEVQAAQLVVAEARGIGLNPGTILDSEKPLILKQGQHITLISDTGATIKLDGPYDRAPAAGPAGGVNLSQTLAVLVTQRQARLSEYSTTRGAAPSKLPDPWLVDVTHSGNACLLESHSPVLWRPETKSTSVLTIMPGDHSWKAQVKWSVGQDHLPLTSGVPMHAGATYIVTYNNVESAITMTLVPAILANDSMRAAWMVEKGCETQAEALLAPEN